MTGGVDVQPEAGVVVEPAPDLVDPADGDLLDPASAPEIIEDAEQPAGAKPPRVAKRVNDRLRKVADDVRTGVRGAVSEATKAADRIRSSLKPKRRSSETASDTVRQRGSQKTPRRRRRLARLQERWLCRQSTHTGAAVPTARYSRTA